MGGAGGTQNAFVHQRAAEIVDAGRQAMAHAFGPELDPGRLNVRNNRIKRKARHRVHQYGRDK